MFMHYHDVAVVRESIKDTVPSCTPRKEKGLAFSLCRCIMEANMSFFREDTI